MSSLKYSSRGNVMSQADQEAKGSGTAGGTLALGDCVYPDGTASNKLKKVTNSEAQMDGIVGIADGSYSADGAMTYFQDGDVAPGVLSGASAPDKYFASSAGLVNWAGVPAGEWCREMGSALNATDLQIQLGATKQKPA